MLLVVTVCGLLRFSLLPGLGGGDWEGCLLGGGGPAGGIWRLLCSSDFLSCLVLGAAVDLPASAGIGSNMLPVWLTATAECLAADFAVVCGVLHPLVLPHSPQA